MNAESDVALAGSGRFSCVNPHPHAQHGVVRPVVLGQPALTFDGSGDGILRAPERYKEGIPLSVDLVSAVFGEGLPQDPLMIGERDAVELPAELLQQLGRSLDVREEEGDGADGQLVNRIHAAESPTVV